MAKKIEAPLVHKYRIVIGSRSVICTTLEECQITFDAADVATADIYFRGRVVLTLTK